MSHPNKHSEAPSRPSAKESLQSFIERKKAEQESQVVSSASEKMAGTQEDVAEVLAGFEKPSDKVSERKGESGNRGDLRAGGSHDDAVAAGAVRFELKDYDFPKPEVMVSKVRVAIQAQIRQELKDARKYHKHLANGSAVNYSKAIARARELKGVLTSLLDSTVDYLKTLYVKFFTPDGKRRRHVE
jgi:hypothetical protein